jgi:hypothetical protein
MLARMTDSSALARTRSKVSYRNPLGRLRPVSFSDKSLSRFRDDRIGEYRERIGGEGDERQRLIIEQMISAEWQKLRCENEAQRATGKDAYDLMRLAAEWSRQLILLDRNLASATPRPSQSKASKPGPSQITLEQHLEMIAQRDGAACCIRANHRDAAADRCHETEPAEQARRARSARHCPER